MRAHPWTVAGDVNHDGTVDIFDALMVRATFGSTREDPDWNPDPDLNRDGIIDVFDALIVRAHFGETV